ncbi:hypothetical protein DSM21852_34550 [Methylocystis bryophila]|nr:hypothetical protein DSM21852_34550 [Methylocystis bryophila]
METLAALCDGAIVKLPLRKSVWRKPECPSMTRTPAATARSDRRRSESLMVSHTPIAPLFEARSEGANNARAADAAARWRLASRVAER